MCILKVNKVRSVFQVFLLVLGTRWEACAIRGAMFNKNIENFTYKLLAKPIFKIRWIF